MKLAVGSTARTRTLSAILGNSLSPPVDQNSLPSVTTNTITKAGEEASQYFTEDAELETAELDL